MSESQREAGGQIYEEILKNLEENKVNEESTTK